ncbi:MAG: OsmC family protein [Calditrichota bacterium]|jgi:lipoyl-dependent peroxiredoxin
MPVRKSSAVWEGNLTEGKGIMKLGSGAFEGNYSFSSRFEQGKGSNPEELIGAAHAGCFSMALAGILGSAGYKPRRIDTVAEVSITKAGEGFQISQIVLKTEAEVPDISENDFLKHANEAKANCPVSRALKAVDTKLEAHLKR